MATYLVKLRNLRFYQRIVGNLRSKLIWSFSMVAVLSLLIGVSAIVSVNLGNAQLQGLIGVGQREPELLQRALASFVSARTNDITFLRVYPEQGFTFALAEYVEPWRSEIETLNATLFELKTLADENGNLLLSQEEIAEIDSIIVSVDTYAGQFEGVVDTIRQQVEGTEFIDSFSENTIALEGLIASLERPDLDVALMRIRQLELDFLLMGGDEDVVAEHTAAVGEFRKPLVDIEADSITKSEIQRSVATYTSQFKSFVNSTRLIEGNLRDYEALANSAEAEIRNKLSTAVATGNAASTAAVTTFRRSVVTLAILSAISFVVSLLAALAIARSVNSQVSSILDMFRRLQAGDFSARASVTSVDELGEIAESVNAVMDNNATLIQTREESEAIQQSIAQLRSDISNVAQGDLTTEAQVTQNITGAIADSFNIMIEQLREVITQVRDASVQVSSSANEIQTTAEHLSLGSQQQSAQILDTTSAIDEMSVSIQRVSENAAVCATVSQQARTNTELGAHAVQQAIGSIQDIRTLVDSTAGSLNRLDTNIQRLDEVVRSIDRIAERSGILAINASIQAAASSNRGKFILVAREVDELAKQSGEAVQQISQLVRQIQYSTYTATTAIRQTSPEIRQGIHLAGVAGEQLAKIEAVADRLVELIQQISQAARQQARGSETIARSMADISQVTQQNANGTQQTTVSIGNLARLAHDLQTSVSRFKLSNESLHRQFAGD